MGVNSQSLICIKPESNIQQSSLVIFRGKKKRNQSMEQVQKCPLKIIIKNETKPRLLRNQVK